MFKEEIKFYRDIVINNGDVTKVNCKERQCVTCKLAIHNKWCGFSYADNIKIANKELDKIENILIEELIKCLGY